MGHAGAWPAGAIEAGGLDWRRTSLGPPEAWPPALVALTQAMAGHDLPAFLLWGPDRRLIYNEAYAQACPDQHPSALGQPLAVAWADAPKVRASLERACDGETLSVELAGLKFCCTPIRLDGETVAGVSCLGAAAPDLAERRFAFQLELDERLRGASEPKEVLAIAAQALGEHLGASRAGYAELEADGEHINVDRDWTIGDAASVAGRYKISEFAPELIGALNSGRSMWLSDVTTEPRVRASDAERFIGLGVRSTLTVPLVKGGRMIAMLYLHHTMAHAWSPVEIKLAEDVAQRTWTAVERARAEATLRESEARFRAMADSAPAPVWVTGAAGGIEFVNQAFVDYAGRPREQLLGDAWISLIHADDLPVAMAARAKGRADLEPYVFEARFRRQDGEWRLLQANSRPRFDGAGAFQGYVGLAVDVTNERQAALHQRLLINELNHRVKNTLATVQSIASQTLRRAEGGEPVRELLTARLMALSAAHNVLTRENWEGADLREVVMQAIAPYDPEGRSRFALDGPALRVAARAALALAMALHELATNAAKYGALSVEAGVVRLTWTFEPGHGEGAVALEWREEGGPPVSPPRERGFGTRLLQQGLAIDLGGAAELTYAPEGLVCRIRAPALATPQAERFNPAG